MTDCSEARKSPCVNLESQAQPAPSDLSGREIRILRSQSGAVPFVTGAAYELVVGDSRIGELRMSSARKGFGALNEGEAITDEGSWHLRRPATKLRPHIDVTDVSDGAQVASYDSKVFGDGRVELVDSGTFTRPGSPHRSRYRVEDPAGDPVLELDARRLSDGEGAVHIGNVGLSRRDIVLLTVVVCFARLLFVRVGSLA